MKINNLEFGLYKAVKKEFVIKELKPFFNALGRLVGLEETFLDVMEYSEQERLNREVYLIDKNREYLGFDKSLIRRLSGNFKSFRFNWDRMEILNLLNGEIKDSISSRDEKELYFILRGDDIFFMNGYNLKV